MKNLLVPCDFSKPAISAFQVALDIAAQSKGKIHLLHAIQLPVLHDSVIMPVLSFEEVLFKELREKAEKQFSVMLKKFPKSKVQVVTKICFGVPFQAILEYIPEHFIDQVIMGSHGAHGLREFVIGSTAEKIVRNSPKPVLIVKDYDKAPVKNIVFPNTLETEDQAELVEKVKALQGFYKAHLHIVWINTPLNFVADNLTLERLNDFAKRYTFRNYTIHTFSHTGLEEGIHQFSKSVKGDIIALGTHGRKGLSRLTIGSITESIVNHSKGLVWSYIMKNDPVNY